MQSPGGMVEFLVNFGLSNFRKDAKESIFYLPFQRLQGNTFLLYIIFFLFISFTLKD